MSIMAIHTFPMVAVTRRLQQRKTRPSILKKPLLIREIGAVFKLNN
jgi:hypothetical protein